jgi:iron complex transport system ATP-binding protein
MSGRVDVKALAVEGVSYAYGERVVVDGVSLVAKAGEIVAIVGPNGCGKSTLLRVAIGELRARAGKVLLDGRDCAGMSRVEVASGVSLVPQQAGGAMGFGYTVREMVLMARHAAHARAAGGGLGAMVAMGFETAEDVELANKAMWAADVHHLAERRVTELSGGERQRVAIARAFTQDTSVILLDEPTSSLDLYHQLALLEQLHVAAGEGRVVVMVTHDLNLAAEHASRVVVMDGGKVAAVGTPGEVLTAGVLEGVYRVKVRAQGGVLRFSK